MNTIYIIEEKYQDKWHSSFANTWLGHCFSLKTAKKFAQEYFDKYYTKEYQAIKCQYLQTKFIIK